MILYPVKFMIAAASIKLNRKIVGEYQINSKKKPETCILLVSGESGTAYENRTRHSSVKGMRLNRLTNAAFCKNFLSFLRKECKDISQDYSRQNFLQ